MAKINTTRRRVQFSTTGQTMTRQSHKKECDINNIVYRYRKDGVITHLNKHGETYDDVSGADYRKWMNKLVSAREMFEELPSHVRNKFGNDPSIFLDYVQDPDNMDEMRKIGLAKGTIENPADSSLLNPSSPSTVNDPSAVAEDGSNPV
jgi:phage internal scaffolding protein